MELIAYFKQFAPLSEEMEGLIDAVFTTHTFEKGHQLLEHNHNSKKIFFFETGFARNYYYKDGKDITHYFFGEGSFAAPIDSIFLNKTSPIALEVLEKSTVRITDYSNMAPIVDEVPEVGKMVRMLLIQGANELSDRLYSIQCQTAAERYKGLLQTHPHLLQKASLGHIASYLGITQQTLSVIRAQIF